MALRALWTKPPKKFWQGADPAPLPSGNVRILGSFGPPAPPLRWTKSTMMEKKLLPPTCAESEHHHQLPELCSYVHNILFLKYQDKLNKYCLKCQNFHHHHLHLNKPLAGVLPLEPQHPLAQLSKPLLLVAVFG